MLLVLLIGIVLAFLAYLAYGFVTYAMPLAVGIYVGMLAHESGAGSGGAYFIGGLAALVCLWTMRVLFARLRSLPARALLSIIFVTPPAFVTYALVWQLTAEGDATFVWRIIISALSALIISVIAWAKLIQYDQEPPAE
ncbi:hypothetical protein [Vitreimonas sp.]|uniref:hypothetical protein n=1 Tax=Vitreimonas sp. TaxID=3069702 RepID=UPI002ED99BA1